MDRLIREANPPTGQLASPKPQYKKPGVDEYEPVEGQHGAPFATLKDASGNIVSPATEEKLEQVRQLLAGVATEAKLEQARVLLNAISNKDFATQATLEVVQSELALIKSELDNIKQNQTSGDQKVQLSGTMAQNVISRAVRRDSVLNNNVTVPDWAKGAIVEHIIFAATGTFQPGDEGARLSVYGRDSKYRASVWALRFKHIAGSSVIQQAYIYPGADFGDISTVGSFNEILVGALPLPRRLRIDVEILGDFDVKQGIDSEVNIMWLR